MGSSAAIAPLHPTLPARRDLAVDVALTAAAAAITLLTMAQDDGRLDAAGVALGLLASLPLLARRRTPLLVFALTAAASTAVNALGYELSVGPAPTFMLYLLAVRAVRPRPWLTGVTVVGLFLAQVGADAADGTWSPLPIPLIGWLVVWRAGEIVRERRERAAARASEIERDRRLAVARERTRIARDLHDSAGHAISVILVQAGAARLIGERDPAAARAALQTIEDVARDTIEEIDRLVGVLRDDDTAADIRAPRGLAALDGLVERRRAAGLDVTVETRGEPLPLDAQVDHAAYGILREALTNAARHGAGTARVEIGFGASSLGITVTNPVAGGRGTGAEGHGIVGMRERALLVDGHLSAGAEGGEFRVAAEVPVGPGRR